MFFIVQLWEYQSIKLLFVSRMTFICFCNWLTSSGGGEFCYSHKSFHSTFIRLSALPSSNLFWSLNANLNQQETGTAVTETHLANRPTACQLPSHVNGPTRQLEDQQNLIIDNMQMYLLNWCLTDINIWRSCLETNDVTSWKLILIESPV